MGLRLRVHVVVTLLERDRVPGLGVGVRSRLGDGVVLPDPVRDTLGLCTTVRVPVAEGVALGDRVLGDCEREAVGDGLRPEGEAERVDCVRVALSVGVGVAVGLWVSEGVCVGDREAAEGVAEVGVGEPVPESDAVTERVSVAAGVGELLAVAVEAVGLQDRLGDADGLGLREGVAVHGALHVGDERVGEGGLGVWLWVPVGEAEGAVAERVREAERLRLPVGGLRLAECVEVKEGVQVCEAVPTGEGETVAVGVRVGVGVNVLVNVWEGEKVGMGVGEGVAVRGSVREGLELNEGVRLGLYGAVKERLREPEPVA